MRYTKEELVKTSEVYLKAMAVVYGCTDAHFFYTENEAKAHCLKNRVEYFEFKKTKKAEK